MITPEIIGGRLGNKMFQIAYLYAQMQDGVIPDIFVQDPKYFEKHEYAIKKLFGNGIGYLSQVGVHVRRGKNPIDPNEPAYSENPFYFNLEDISYYEQAMKLFPKSKFLVFSDDNEWCLEKFKGNPDVEVMDKSDEITDFNLLASCNGIIGCNSSFSWWAAFLCPNPSAKIVFPSKEHWYSDGIERTVCPQSWIRI